MEMTYLLQVSSRAVVARFTTGRRWELRGGSECGSICNQGLRGFAIVAMSAIGEGNITFWQRLKRQKHGLGNMALAASTLLLALRLVDQDKELERMRAGESSLLEALRRENQSVQERFAGFRAAVEAEVERAGSRLPPLSTRLRTLLEKSEIEEPRPLVSHEQKEGQEPEVLQSQGKGKASFMV